MFEKDNFLGLESISTPLKHLFQLLYLEATRWKRKLCVWLQLFLVTSSILVALLLIITYVIIQARRGKLCEEIRILSNDAVIYKCRTSGNFPQLFRMCNIKLLTGKESVGGSNNGTTEHAMQEAAGKCQQVMDELQEKNSNLSSLEETWEIVVSISKFATVFLFFTFLFDITCWVIFKRML